MQDQHCSAIGQNLNAFGGAEEIKRAAAMIRDAQDVFTCGNGGDALLASHFAMELMKFGQASAISLASDMAMTTMIANDFGYENIFRYQLIKYATCNDLLICLSTSGVSPNILSAAEIADSLGMKILAILGKQGAEDPRWPRGALVIPVPGDGPMEIEDLQHIICHAIVNDLHGKE